MEFDYACFISYKHPKTDLMRRIGEDLCSAIEAEIKEGIDAEVFLDKTRMTGGAFIEDHISSAIYKSVCMVVIYTAPYFNRKETYCAREFKGMERLEAKRLELLPEDERKYGLIIPIVVRGMDSFPDEIKNKRLFYDFESLTLAGPKIINHPDFAPKIKEIADYIRLRCAAFSKIDKKKLDQIKKFNLPTEKEITSWLHKITSNKLNFLGREVSK